MLKLSSTRKKQKKRTDGLVTFTNMIFKRMRISKVDL